ncbi:DUF1836 domain-containing protein [Streptococcus ovis]|uniref:DUF1836 domain-containing protein n=1 Tax=Streptococcus ovis TaxID=82806 RepID=UPI00036AABC5
MKQLPNWKELPSLDLYLDQVLLYVNQETATYLSHSEKPLTAAMVNNYVKHGYLPKPVKKKYGRLQIARLIVLTLCKPIFAITDICQMIEVHYQDADSKVLYDCFVDCLMGKEQDEVPELILKACQAIQAYQEAMKLIDSLTETTSPNNMKEGIANESNF